MARITVVRTMRFQIPLATLATMQCSHCKRDIYTCMSLSGPCETPKYTGPHEFVFEFSETIPIDRPA